MRFILKILAFTALLLISKITKEDKLIPASADNPQVIVSTAPHAAEKPLPVLSNGNMQQHQSGLYTEPVQTFVVTQATIK
ncbi:hypothetical protein [Pontibacter pudoricolor]|uniref:hypothetical protein n=1 Tax=Pontibacter pudoricolor TaxID=2694930 RepID=UPI001391B9A9|nr:hypothetical protein [Pontibacter pudoricolor]